MLTITLNAALDVTYEVNTLHIGESHSVVRETGQAGGTGINVARIVNALRPTAVVTGLVAGKTGTAIRDDLRLSGLPDELIDVSGESRRTVTVVDSQAATAFNETGDRLEVEWHTVEERLLQLAGCHRVVVASGSIPPGVPTDVYARIVRVVHGAGGVVIIDAAGDSLLEAARAGADLVKPNARELMDATGRSDIGVGISDLLEMGAGGVAASLGTDGIRLHHRGRALHGKLSHDVEGNPTGAGDAAVAALAIGIEEGWTPEELLRHAVALSASAVAHPLAGHVSQPLYLDSLQSVTIEELSA